MDADETYLNNFLINNAFADFEGLPRLTVAAAFADAALYYLIDDVTGGGLVPVAEMYIDTVTQYDDEIRLTADNPGGDVLPGHPEYSSFLRAISIESESYQDLLAGTVHGDGFSVEGSPDPFTLAANYGIEVTLLAGHHYQIRTIVLCQATLEGAASFVAGADAGCDASHSVYWNGLTHITDLFGRPVTGVTETSGSGFDYRYASPLSPFPAAIPPLGGVPEPASWALLIAGFGLTGAAMRRRRAAPAA